MRRYFFWFGWAVLIALPIAFVFEIWWIQDLPKIAVWQWLLPLVAIGIIAASRNRDDVLKHHVV